MSEPTVEPRAVLPPFNWRVPVLGDVPNIPSDITNLGTDIAATVLRGVPIFTNAAARDAAIPAPVEGQRCYLQAEGYYTSYVTAKWVHYWWGLANATPGSLAVGLTKITPGSWPAPIVDTTAVPHDATAFIIPMDGEWTVNFDADATNTGAGAGYLKAAYYLNGLDTGIGTTSLQFPASGRFDITSCITLDLRSSDRLEVYLNNQGAAPFTIHNANTRIQMKP